MFQKSGPVLLKKIKKGSFNVYVKTVFLKELLKKKPSTISFKKRIEVKAGKPEIQTGKIELTVNPLKKVLKINWFYPLIDVDVRISTKKHALSRKGIGKMVLQEVIKYAEKKKLKYVQVIPHSEGMQKLLESSGFKPLGKPAEFPARKAVLRLYVYKIRELK